MFCFLFYLYFFLHFTILTITILNCNSLLNLSLDSGRFYFRFSQYDLFIGLLVGVPSTRTSIYVWMFYASEWRSRRRRMRECYEKILRIPNVIYISLYREANHIFKINKGKEGIIIIFFFNFLFISFFFLVIFHLL